ncbi:hypothetical protein [Rhodococcus jostii]
MDIDQFISLVEAAGHLGGTLFSGLGEMFHGLAELGSGSAGTLN